MSPGTIIAMTVAGFLLVFLEVFIPGGILGLIGALLVAAAIVAAYVFQGAGWGTALLLGSGVGGIVGFWLWLKLFPKTPVGRKLMLDNDARDWHSSDLGKRDLVGKTGIAHSMLRPAGTALIDGQRVDVVTRGEIVEAKSAIKVIVVEGNRVVVTAVAE